jgi:hypothetical protein
MRPRAWLVLALLAPRAAFGQSASAESAWPAAAVEGVRAAAAGNGAVRAAFLDRLRRNPVAAEFAVPLLEDAGGVTIEFRGEAEDPGLKGVWACYKRDRKALVFNRDALNEDFAARGIAPLGPGAAPSPAQSAELADRFMPVIVHEVGGHARNYADLQRLLGRPGPNVRETETDALRLEAMATAAERKRNPSYLRDGGEYAKTESGLVDEYWKDKTRGSPEDFRKYVSGIPGYAKIASSLDPGADPAVAAYYRADERKLLDSDKRLVGDSAPDDEVSIVRPDPFEGGAGRRR